MRYFFSTLTSILLLVSCGQTQTQAGTKKEATAIQLPSKEKPSANEAVATFSEGCFWHAEIIFQSLVGVRDAVSGYAGGTTSDPDYDKVSTGQTGHAETVQIYYDPSKISYETLVKALFASMDPTQVNGQGNDVGTEYRTIAFYRNESEKKIIEAEIKRLTDSKIYKNKIVTEVVPFTNFYPAEDYHQEYIYYHPQNSYVRIVSLPEYLEFRKSFRGNFK